MLRPGPLSRDDLAAKLGAAPGAANSDDIVAPGMSAAHYAPAARLRLDALSLATDEAGLDFGGRLAAVAPPDAIVLDLSPIGDLTEAAANLFALLREIDVRGLRRVAVAPIPAHGLGEAINDRLRRAAAG